MLRRLRRRRKGKTDESSDEGTQENKKQMVENEAGNKDNNEDGNEEDEVMLNVSAKSEAGPPSKGSKIGYLQFNGDTFVANIRMKQDGAEYIRSREGQNWHSTVLESDN